jgi:large subunit ribosomal protein L29
MKAAKWRDLSEDELLQKARGLSEEIFNLRFQLSMGVAKNPSRIGQARRDLARAYTIQRERGGAPLAVAAVATPAAEPTTSKKKSSGRTKSAPREKAGKAPRASKAAAKKKSAKG